MKKIDKLRAIDLAVFDSHPTLDGTYLAVLYYDVRKLKRLSDDELSSLIFNKTLKLYPFAVINPDANRFNSKRTAFIEMYLPLSPALRVTKEEGL